MAIRRLFALMAAIGLILVAAIPVAANDRNHYGVHVLATGPSPDADLVNGWGISRLPTSPWWVADNGTDLVHPLQGRWHQAGPARRHPDGRADRHRVEHHAADFHGDLFLFSSEAGVISGWRGALGTTAEVGNGDHAGDAVYKGLAIATADVGKGMATVSLRDRLPQRADRRLRQLVRVADLARRLHRPEAARRATRRSASRTSRA